jgi:Leucine-rich repeat (LRR) protein
VFVIKTPRETPTVTAHIVLQDNRLADVSALSTLVSLRSLELGRNRLEGLDCLSRLTRLTLLSLEGNQLITLAGAGSRGQPP